jgi:glyoxalase family protein
MLSQIKGLHHVTSLASSAQRNNRFFTQLLGLRRVKKTVNFDAPDVYHLYYGDRIGTAGTVMTYFPFPNAGRGSRGTGEVGTVAFSVPPGTINKWGERLVDHGVSDVIRTDRFGDRRMSFDGPDGERLALVECSDDRAPWTASLDSDMAVRGFHSASLRLAEEEPMAELMHLMGYEEHDRQDNRIRFIRPGGNAANIIDFEILPDAGRAVQGAGSVHHIAFSVDNRQKQLEVRKALQEAGHSVTEVIDRDYFWAIYFRTPGGVLFEVATNEPGFTRDEDEAHLGEALKLPDQHAHLREKLEAQLEPIED